MNSTDLYSINITAAMRSSLAFMRLSSVFTLLMFVNALLFPTVTAAQVVIEQNQPQNTLTIEGNLEQRMTQTLRYIQDYSGSTHQSLVERLAGENSLFQRALNVVGLSTLTLENLDELQYLAQQLNQLHNEAVAEFDATDAWIKQQQLPESIIERNAQAKAHYLAQHQPLQQSLNRINTANSLIDQHQAAENLQQHIQHQHLHKSHQHTNLEQLPWGTPDADTVRKPLLDSNSLNQHTHILPHQHNPSSKLAAVHTIPEGMLNAGNGGPTTEDLAQTPDIQLSDAIKAKAAELNHDPVKIYNWVRNNIEYIPSYGSIQGAHYSLQAGKANALDTASLLIALLRASNIPARYAYGTVDIPIDQAMNWVGGVTDAGAAQQLLGQGGIPNAAIITAGQISHIRLEHSWVEAWIDYFPSRGAKHKIGDNWLPLDASFKQYDFGPQMDIANNVNFDADALVQNIQNKATINEAEGWVQNIPQADIQTQLENFQTQVKTYIEQQNANATIGDVLGTQKVILKEHLQLAAGLPYQMIARADSYSSIPDNLRHKFRYTLGTNQNGLQSTFFTIEQSLPELAGKKLALSFKPTAKADEDVIASTLPKPDPNTGEIDPNQLPTSLPGYLINLTAEFTLNGQTIASADAGKMGSELQETLSLYTPTFKWTAPANNIVIAGEYRAIGLSLQDNNPEEAAQLQAQVTATKAKLDAAQNGDNSQLGTLTKQQLVGDLLHATIYSYFALNNIQDQLQSKAANIVQYNLPSFGIFSTALNPSYWYGSPRSVDFAGMLMDVDYASTQLAAKNNSKAERINYLRSRGMRRSAMEHLVPEQMYSTDTSKAHGISAVKAIQIAAQQGQKIYTITQANLSTAMPQINLNSSAKQEIRNAINAGKTVTTHTDKITYQGITSAGYIIFDEATGSGAYKIATGEDGAKVVIDEKLGGFLTILSLLILGYALFATLLAAPAIVLSITTALGVIVSIISIIRVVTLSALNGCSIELTQTLFVYLSLAIVASFLIPSLIFFMISLAILNIFMGNWADNAVRECKP